MTSSQFDQSARLKRIGYEGSKEPTLSSLHPGVEQETPHEPMRFIDVGGELTLQAKLRDAWEHISVTPRQFAAKES